MKIQSYLKKANIKEIIICLSLIVIGYMTAQLFMRKYNRFSVGAQKCECTNTSGTNCLDGADSNTSRNSKFCTDQTTQDTCLSAGGRIGPGKFVGKNTCKWIPGPPGPPTPGPPTPGPPTPGPPAGKPPAPPPTPTVSCSSTGLMNFGDKCINNGSVVDDPSNDPNCKKLKDCHYSMFYKIPIYLIILGVIIFFGILIFALS